MKHSSNYLTTLSGVMDVLKQRGQDMEFTYKGNGNFEARNKSYRSMDLTIIRTFRFEGNTDPSDEATLYQICANDGLIGYLIDAYGTYTNYGADFQRSLQAIPLVHNHPGACPDQS